MYPESYSSPPAHPSQWFKSSSALSRINVRAPKSWGLNWRHFCPLGCLTKIRHFWMSQRGRGCHFHLEAKDAAKHPTMHRTDLHKKELFPPHTCQLNEVEKSCVPTAAFNPFPAKSVLNIPAKMVMPKLKSCCFLVKSQIFR